jgi:hypothetical protein
MPQKYLLTKNYVSKDTLNRLTKQIIDNSKVDRQQALDLFTDVHARLGNAETNLIYAELVKTAIPILKQVQEVNSTLLKAMSLVQGYLIKNGGKRGGTEGAVDLFQGLSKLTGVEDDEKDDD